MKMFSGTKLKKILEEKGINQTTLAERLDITQPSISQWIYNKAIP